jgi:putative FmdB family regulatory protein
MPVYEYACDKCGHEFEREQRITDDPVKTCPSCRARKVRRLISRTAFVLKGGGWYSDLYSSRKPSASEAEGGKKAETDGKADSGSAATSEGKSGASPGEGASPSGPKGKPKASKAA